MVELNIKTDMENNQLDKLLQGDTDGIDAAVKSIHNYYSGKFNPIKTSVFLV